MAMSFYHMLAWPRVWPCFPPAYIFPYLFLWGPWPLLQAPSQPNPPPEPHPDEPEAEIHVPAPPAPGSPQPQVEAQAPAPPLPAYSQPQAEAQALAPPLDEPQTQGQEPAQTEGGGLDQQQEQRLPAPKAKAKAKAKAQAQPNADPVRPQLQLHLVPPQQQQQQQQQHQPMQPAGPFQPAGFGIPGGPLQPPAGFGIPGGLRIPGGPIPGVFGIPDWVMWQFPYPQPERAFGATTFQEERRRLIVALERLNGESFAGYAAALQELEMEMRWASGELCNDREAMLPAVQVHGPILQYCSQALLNDPEVVLAALERHPKAALAASETLRSDRDFVLRAVRIFGGSLEHASEELRADREVVLAAVQRTGRALKHASIDLRNDEEVVLAAIGRSARALQYAGDALRADREVVQKALMRQQGELSKINVLRFAAPVLKEDKDLVLLAVRLSTTPEGALDGYEQAPASVRRAIPWRRFVQVADSSIACQGEAAPVLTVRISETELWDESSSELEEGVAMRGFLCEASLMSGTTFRCIVSDSDSEDFEQAGPDASGLCNLNDVAKKLISELPGAAEVERPKRIAMLIATQTEGGEDKGLGSDDHSDEDKSYLARPWDWHRPISDFLAV